MKWLKYFSSALAVACIVIQSTAAQVEPKSSGSTSNTNISENYVIVPLDVLRFRILGESETDTELRVANDGSVTLPYIGAVQVAGLTMSQARSFLYEKYSADYYVNPQIDMTISSYKQKRVNVQGMVNQQGFVVFPPEEKMSLMGAIALAGGWNGNRLADKTVKLIRKDSNGELKTIKIDTTKIGQDDWPLEDGDMIIVPERVF